MAKLKHPKWPSLDEPQCNWTKDNHVSIKNNEVGILSIVNFPCYRYAK